MVLREIADRPTPDQLRQALLGWVPQEVGGIAVTLTFAPEPPSWKLTWLEAQEAVRQYLRLLAGRAFGRGGLRRKQRLSVFTVREGSPTGFTKHLHYHLAIQIPPRFTGESWAEVARSEWQRIHLASEKQNAFCRIENSGWLDYMLKLADKPDYLYAIDIENCHFTCGQ